jgi:hypothetical protein
MKWGSVYLLLAAGGFGIIAADYVRNSTWP